MWFTRNDVDFLHIQVAGWEQRVLGFPIAQGGRILCLRCNIAVYCILYHFLYLGDHAAHCISNSLINGILPFFYLKCWIQKMLFFYLKCWIQRMLVLISSFCSQVLDLEDIVLYLKCWIQKNVVFYLKFQFWVQIYLKCWIKRMLVLISSICSQVLDSENESSIVDLPWYIPTFSKNNTLYVCLGLNLYAHTLLPIWV